MTESLVDLVRRKRAVSVVRSIQASEHTEKYLHNKAELTKELLGHTTDIDINRQCARQLSYYYYNMKARYNNKPVVTHSIDTERSRKLWARVQEACMRADVSPERYMKAQFMFFHTAFGTTPQLNQLATDAAVDRARAYAGKTTGAVVSNAIEITPELGSLFSRCDQQVRDVCAARRITREEYYKTFVLTKLIPMPTAFLEADPIYKKVVNDVNACNLPTTNTK